MFNNNTGGEWENFGRNGPYFGVITHDKFHRFNLTDEIIEDFFETGILGLL